MIYRVTVFVGDVDESLSRVALAYDSTSFLVDHSNYKTFLASDINKDTTIYTSLGDLPKDLEIFYNIVMLATEIVYAPPSKWSDSLCINPANPTASLQGYTENVLLCISGWKPIKNIESCYFTPTINPLVDVRQSADPQLWFAGCSFTYGIGVNASERYGQLVSNSLNLPCSFLAKSGSSIAWAADQILRSDINSGDIVVWGLTATERTSFIKDSKLLCVNIGSYDQFPELETELPISALYNETTFYSHLYAIEQVINYCNKQQATLVLIGLLISNNMLRYLKTKNNYFHYHHNLQTQGNQLIETYADLGTDNKHPGIKQHKLYKDFVLTNLLKLQGN